MQPITNCIIASRLVYKCDPNETSEEKLYIPVKELKRGCTMKIKKEEKYFFLRISKFMWKWYVEIWQLPYKNTDYSKLEIAEFIRTNRMKASFPM